MKIYLAPLEGITNHIYRNAYSKIYGNIDKYFAPFISPSEKAPMTPRERRDVAPENNSVIYMVPQILTCRSDLFIEAAKELHDMGYKEINLNLGCPSGTVCAKGKGAGFLPETLALQRFLDDIYSNAEAEGIQISIKTRLGYYDPDEFYDLVDIFNAFPVSELIVHPRIRGDFYKGDTRKEYFAYALEHSNAPLVYNGNIFTSKDYDELTTLFHKDLDPVMLGRGLISDPSLADKLKGNTTETDLIKFRKLHDTLYNEYKEIMSPDINILHKMRELWSYWQVLFNGHERDIKRIIKAKKCAEYEDVVYHSMLS
ncbi:MAG: tRNA-dihydrouridine synthase family protein [Saccharofermentans sp.]|nr:tRNA-dihydrouridine synthase family protein [Saccharofermentans sp.]